MNERTLALTEATLMIPDGESLDDFVGRLLDESKPLALNAAFGGESFEPADQITFGCWPSRIYADKLILTAWRSPRRDEERGESKTYSIAFEAADTGLSFGDPVEVEVRYSVDFEPVGESLERIDHLRRAVEGGGDALGEMRRLYADEVAGALRDLDREVPDFEKANALLAEVSGWHPAAHALGEAISKARLR